MSEDKNSRDGAPASGTRPRPGESTRPNHPVLKRNGLPVELIKSPPPSGPGKLVSKTFVVDQDSFDVETKRNPILDEGGASPEGGKAGQDGANAASLAGLFDDEDIPTLHYDKQPEPFSEESLVLTPESLDSATEAAGPGPGQNAGAVPPPKSSQAPWQQPQSQATTSLGSARGRSKASMVIFMIIGGLLIVAASAVVGAVLVFRSTGSEPSAGNVANVSDTASQPTVEGATERPSERPATGGSAQAGTAEQATAVGVPVPIDPSESASPSGQEGATEGAAVVAGEETASEEGAEGTGAEGTEPAEVTEEAGEPEGDPGGEAPSTSGDLASVLSPLTDRVRQCTRREQGYHPRALTVHLVPGEEGRRRLQAITPPTPPRVVGCIARLLGGVTLPSATVGSGDRMMYTFELR